VIRTVFVTGASSGIGLQTLLHVAELGFDAVGLVPDGSGGEHVKGEA
jgi:NAD(P)-dependent dehydrogenase (short-subunit alcohol dehydrogenase family)